MTKRIDVAVIRESINKLVGLLTDRNITVTQRGMQAYVAYTPTGKIKSMNVPYLPDNASEEFIAAVQGFVDHEVGHVLHTDPAIVKKAAKLGTTFAGMHNIIEDTYIERMMQQSFYGSKRTLDAVRHFHIHKIAAPKIEEAIKLGDMATASAYLIVLVFRAWGGQRLAKEYIRSTPALARLTDGIEGKIGLDLFAKLGNMRSSEDCYSLTAEVLKRMEPAEAPKPKPKTKSKPTSLDESQPEAGDDEGEPEDDKSAPEDGKGDSGSDETSMGESKADDKTGDDQEEHPEESASSSSAEYDDDDGNQDDGEGIGSEVSESVEEQEDENREARGAAAAEEDKSVSDDDKEAEAETGLGTAGDDPADDEGDSAIDADDGSKKDSTLRGHREGSVSSPDEEKDVPDDEPEGEDLSLDEIFDKFVDFDDSVSEGLSSEARSESSKVIAPVFSRDFDTIGTFEYQATEERTRQLINRVTPMVAPMAKSLQRALAAKDKVTWNPGQRKGRINAGSLYRSAVGDDRVFRTRYETKAKNTAVTLLVDCSGSMNSDGRIVSAFQAAFALSSTLDRLKITHEVIGFTTTSNRLPEFKRAARKAGGDIYYPRGEPLYMPVFKGFDERLGFQQQARMAYMTTYSASGLLRENVDGESLRVAADRLRRQKAERRIVIVLSDGSPACGDMGLHSADTMNRHYELAGGIWPLYADLKLAVKETMESGVDVVGIGIQHPGVKSFYPKSINLSSVSSLPTKVMDELTKLLLS